MKQTARDYNIKYHLFECELLTEAEIKETANSIFGGFGAFRSARRY